MKKQMNAFIPYEKNNEHHEDHLTRGFLILLRYSSAAFYMFYDYLREEYLKKITDDSEPTLENLFLSHPTYDITTQVGCEQAKDFLNSKILSILITDERIKLNKAVSCSERRAVYDGVIALNNDWTFIIENKPAHCNVWEEQLSVGKILGNYIINDDYYLVKFPVVLTWREIFKRLSNLKCSNIEKMLITDFQDFVFINYPELFPYEKFNQCKLNRQLLDLRIEKLLQSFIDDNENKKIISYQTNWANKIILNYDCINQIDYRPVLENKSIAIFFAFGFKVSQSRAFIDCVNLSKLEKLSDYDKQLKIRIADSYGREIYSIYVKKGAEIEFINYWKEHKMSIGQKSTSDFYNNLLQGLCKLSFLQQFDQDELVESIGKNRKQIRIMPAMNMEYNFSLNDVYEFEQNNILERKFIDKTLQGLSIVQKEEEFKKLLKRQYKEDMVKI